MLEITEWFYYEGFTHFSSFDLFLFITSAFLIYLESSPSLKSSGSVPRVSSSPTVYIFCGSLLFLFVI